MADIPQYKEQVAPTGLPTPFDPTRVPAEALGGATSQSLERLGGVLGGAASRQKRDADLLAREAKKDADTTATIGLMGKAQAEMNKQIIDTTPGSDGYLSLRGDAAVKAKQYAIDTYSDTVDEIAKSAANPDQANTFGHIALALKKEALNHVESHFKRESEVFAQTTYEGTQQEFNRAAAKPSIYAKEEERDPLFNRATGVATREAERRGEDPAMLVGQAQEKIVRTMMDGLLAGKNPNLLQAAAVMGKYGDRLGTEKAKYQARLNDTAEVYDAEVKAATFARAALQPNGQIDYRLGRDIVDKSVPPGPLRDATWARFKERAAVLDKAWSDEASELAGIVGNAGIDPATQRFNVANVPAAMMQALDEKWPTKAVEFRLRSRIADDAQDERDYLLANEQLFGGDAWERTANMPLNQFKATIAALGPKARVRLQKAFDDQQKVVGEPPDVSIVFDEVKKPLGLGKVKSVGQLNPEKQKVFHDVYTAVLQDYRDFRAAHHGAKPGQEDLRRMVSNQLEPVIQIKPAPLDWFGGTIPVKTPRYEAEQGVNAALLDRARKRDRELHPNDPPLTDDELRKVIRAARGY